MGEECCGSKIIKSKTKGGSNVMKQPRFIKDKQKYQVNAIKFLETLFQTPLERNIGDIEIRGFPKEGWQEQRYCNLLKGAAKIAYDFCEDEMDVYFGVNPRIGNAGSKENVPWLTAFHAEIDYGKDGHKKPSEYGTYDEALRSIKNFEIKPTYINHSGGGFHCYWVLSEPVGVSDIGLDSLENVNRNLTAALGGDSGTHNINRILRVPGTYNFKLPNNPREVTVIVDDGPRYDLEVFKPLMNFEKKKKTAAQPKVQKQAIQKEQHQNWDRKISSLPVSEKIKSLIIGGNDGSYVSRSEADQAVVTALVNKGLSESDIKTIFENYKIGEKYREHSSPDDYLKHNIEKAKEFSNLTEEERQDPLFISGSLHKDDNDKYHLKIVRFQEYINKKHLLKFLEKERTFFSYNGKCYEQCYEDRLNYICQNELDKYRELFTPGALKNFFHFSIGANLMDVDQAQENQIRYLTLQNGIYDLADYTLIQHSPDIFTTNLLPYDYDPDARCPRWLKYLDEVFLSDTEKIKFIQEAVGYAFHKSMPTAAMFFLIGDGGNGKSVFINTISSLCGKENLCNVSLNKLNDEKYILELFGKMINVSGETPNNRFMNTDLVKAAVSGDWVTGREVYKRPSKFKPYAKHYLGMNTLPDIKDNTHGMWRRIYVIEFPRKFSEHEMDVELEQKLQNELSGIFNWALEGYKRLRHQNFIFSESDSMLISKQLYQTQSNSVLKFFVNSFKKSDLEDSVALKNVYECYQQFCSDEGHKDQHSKAELRKFFESQGYIVKNSSKHSNQLRIFGIKYMASE